MDPTLFNQKLQVAQDLIQSLVNILSTQTHVSRSQVQAILDNAANQLKVLELQPPQAIAPFVVPNFTAQPPAAPAQPTQQPKPPEAQPKT